MLEDTEFRVRARVEPNSPEAIVLNYLNSRQTLYPSKDMALIALMSYWLPLAYRDDEMRSQESLNRVIRNSIYRLKLHLQYLHQMLGDEGLIEEVVSVEAKPPIKQAKMSLEQAITEGNADPTSNSNSSRHESEEWVNPLKPSARKAP